MLWTILGLIIVGLIAGLIARAVIPGKQSMGILMTIVLGVVGSFVGGFLGYVIFGADPSGGFFQASGLLGSIIGAIIVLGLYVLANRKSVTR
ncbi:GlsB/YeaQ/YmgE family stress response membrane protein [Microbacterium sediminicola]|uniref:GlsB/YeaQ/YmgE family stress response membrane protein n=1 Tax=Microbacterium sediminicola TaxID=415210 RepID=A0ABP4UBA6_9MICO